jgi:hypothetical protein
MTSIEINEVLEKKWEDKHSMMKHFEKKFDDVKIRVESTKWVEFSTTGDKFGFLKEGGEIGRVIFTSSRSKHFSSLNGVIIDTNGKPRILCIPPKVLYPCIISKKMNMKLEKNTHKIYEAEDGTTVNLYYYNGNWVISSTNGFEVNETKWMGNKTFVEIIEELFEMYSIDMSKLDESLCHTIGFKHKNFHPFKPCNKMWYIRSKNLDPKTGFAIVDDDYLAGKLPKQKLITISNSEDVEYLFKSARSALEKVQAGGEALYGYVVRFDNEDMHDLFIESDLMVMIRRSIYYKPPGQTNKYLDNSSRMNYIILRAYLSKKNEKFLELFPQFGTQFKKYDSIFESISTKCIELSRDRKSVCGEDTVGHLAEWFTTKIFPKYRMDPYASAFSSLVEDIIKSHKFLELYFKVIHGEKK